MLITFRLSRHRLSFLIYVLAVLAVGYADASFAEQNARSGENERQNGVIVSPRVSSDTGFLVVAPDRGFLGNEEIRDIFAGFNDVFHAELAFIPWSSDPSTYVTPAVTQLRAGGARRVTILPLFFAKSHSLLLRLREAMDYDEDQLAFAPPFGESFLAEEMLFDRFESAGLPPIRMGGQREDVAVLVVGFGALSDADAASMHTELLDVSESVSSYFELAETKVVVLRHQGAGLDAQIQSFDELEREADQLSETHGRLVVVPYHFGQRMDSMMDLNRTIAYRVMGPTTQFVDTVNVSDTVATTWMAREANRWVPLAADEIGFIVMPHGSDIVWNETIREPLRELVDGGDVEYAFSMADSYVMGRAVQRLEQRGYRGIVVLRVFSQESSFRDRIEYILGLGDKPGFSMGMGPPRRLRSTTVFTTLGGIEDDPLFAEALVERAREVSEQPENETVLLLGHGAGSDEDNRIWLDHLQSLADQIRAYGDDFAAIRWANWREDWPEHRGAAEDHILGIVREELAVGRTVLAIPARTTLTGPEPDELGGLDGVRIGTGFAPHVLFADWVRGELDRGARLLDSRIGWNPDQRASVCEGSQSCGLVVR